MKRRKKDEKSRKRRWGRSGQKQGSDACGEREREREERKGAEMRKGGENEREKIN